jgi:hypothetical protein
MVQFAAVLLRGVIATFVGLLIAGGTLTLAADRAPVDRPTLVPVSPGPVTVTVPDVTAQAYVFAKGILQDHGFAWHVSGPVQGYAANTVSLQRPVAGTVVLDNGAPTITLTLARNPAYIEKGTPENDAPYTGTPIALPANVPTRPQTSVQPRLEPVPIPVSPTVTVPVTSPVTTPATTPTMSPTTTPLTTPATTPVAPVDTTPPDAPIQSPTTQTPAVRPTPATTPTTTPTAPSGSTGPRAPDFTVPGAPKEPARSLPLPDRVAALAAWIEGHHDPSAANLNHWLYEHAFVVAGARFGWWHGAEALEQLIAVDRRAEALWGVGGQSRDTAQKALAEVRSRAA